MIREILGRELTCEEKTLICLTSPMGAGDSGEIACLQQIDPRLFRSLVMRHKLSPFLFFMKHPLFQNLPEQVRNHLKQQAESISRRMLLFAREMVEMERKFRDKGIQVIFLKGPALSMQLFGDVGRRSSIDIDMLVRKNDLNRVGQRLENLNYSAIKSEEGKNSLVRQLFRYAKKDRTYRKDKPAIPVEIHYRLFPNNTYEQQERQFIDNNIGQVLLAGEKISVLNMPLHFLFLAAHGSVHQWYQLFWLRDIAEMVSKEKIFDWKALMAMADAMGLKRSVILAVHLSHLIYHTDIPVVVAKDLKTHPQPYLLKTCLRAIFNPQDEDMQRRIERMWYLSMLNGSIKYKWNTFFGAVGRFLLEG